MATYQQHDHTRHTGFTYQTSTGEPGTIFAYSITTNNTALCGRKQQPTPKTYTLTAMPSTRPPFRPHQPGAKLDGSVLYRRARRAFLKPRGAAFRFQGAKGLRLSLLLHWDGSCFMAVLAQGQEAEKASGL